MTVRAAVYARISSGPDHTALGVNRQIKDCMALAADRGWVVDHPPFVDNDTSATSGKPRRQYDAMMKALAGGQFDALVCWDVDRLTRTPRELEDIVDLHERHRVALASVGGEIDLATPQGRLTARIKGNVARHEAEQLARRVRRKMAERAEAGTSHGRVAYGWQRQYDYDASGRRVGFREVLHPEQAELVRNAAAALLAGQSLRVLVRELNEAGAPTRDGRPWSTTGLRGVLLRDRNAGLRVHRGTVVGRGSWPPIYEEATHRRLVALLTDPGRRTSPGNATRYLLSGIARCGVCGGPLRVLLAGRCDRKADTYVCQANYHVRRRRGELEELVVKTVLGILARPDAVGLLTRDDDEATRAHEQAEALRARLDLAADAYAAGRIDTRQLTRITAQLSPQIEALQQVVRAASSAPDLFDLARPDITERWDELPLARQRAVIAALLEVRVLPARIKGGAERFDPRDVEIPPRRPS